MSDSIQTTDAFFAPLTRFYKQEQIAPLDFQPIGVEKFSALETLINKMSDTFIVSDTINSIKFVHESRWYMEEKTILSELRLS